MADKEILQLLREIRDTQNNYIELYKGALANQQTAIDLQKKAVGRQKILLPVLLILVVVVIAIFFMSAR